MITESESPTHKKYLLDSHSRLYYKGKLNDYTIRNHLKLLLMWIKSSHCGFPCYNAGERWDVPLDYVRLMLCTTLDYVWQCNNRSFF
jgi:hypothetical protein